MKTVARLSLKTKELSHVLQKPHQGNWYHYERCLRLMEGFTFSEFTS